MMTTRFATSATVLLLLAGGSLPAGAQVRPEQRQRQVRQRIEQQFLQRLATDLRLDAAQGKAVGVVLGDWGQRRQRLEVEERELRAAVADQLRPGIAATPDSLSHMVDRLLANRVAYAESFQGEMAALRELLTPVQRAQFLLMRDQLLRRAQQLVQDRPPPPGRQ